MREGIEPDCIAGSSMGGLKEDVRFDKRGLYSVDDVRFSRFGSLVTTAELVKVRRRRERQRD
jgi:hypothetical protein